MAQRRMLSKSISTSKKLNKVSDAAALLFTWALPHLDDFGNIDCAAEVLKATIIPMRLWTPEKVEKARNELISVGAWIPYKENNDEYIHCEKFDAFQTFKKDRERTNLVPDYKDSKKLPMENFGFQMEDSVRPKESRVVKVRI